MQMMMIMDSNLSKTAKEQSRQGALYQNAKKL